MSDNFLKTAGGIRIGSLSSDPSNPKAGDMYFNTTSNVFRFYDGSAWANVTPPGGGGSLPYYTIGTGGDYSTIASAITAAATDDEFLILKGTYTENVSVNKRIKIFGQGYGSVISGTLTFTSAADFAHFSLCKITGNITIDSGANGVQLVEFWTNSSATLTDNGTGSYIQGIEE